MPEGAERILLQRICRHRECGLRFWVCRPCFRGVLVRFLAGYCSCRPTARSRFLQHHWTQVAVQPGQDLFDQFSPGQGVTGIEKGVTSLAARASSIQRVPLSVAASAESRM